MRLNDVLIIIGFSLIITAIYIPKTFSILARECPGQDVPSVRRHGERTELSFIFYYVSWCHQSRAAKEAYDELAHHYYDQAIFAAVNCWHLDCNCSYTLPTALGNRRGNPLKWPTLLVRYGRRMSVQYNDEWKITSLMSFIGNLYKPIERLSTKEDLKTILMRSNAVVLGLFPNASISDYRKFAFAAVKWLENDPKKLVPFAVAVGTVAKELAHKFGITMPIIVLLSDKETNIFNSTAKWNANNVNLWLETEFMRLRKQFNGFSTPLILAEHVRKGPVLSIFVNELENSKFDFYEQMLSVLGSLSYVLPQKLKSKQCESLWASMEKDERKLSYGNELRKEFEANNSISCKAKLLMNNAYTRFNDLRLYFSRAYLRQFQPSVQLQADDPYASGNLLELHKYNECLRLPSSKGTTELQIIIAKLLVKFIEKIALNSNGNLKNRTMSVHLLDAHKYQDVLHDLGVSNYEKSPTTTALIIEPSQEGFYVMEKPFHHETLLYFINNYYNESLQFLRRSSVELPKQISGLYLDPLNRNMFLNSIKHHWRNTTTVLLLYSPRCAISWLMSNALLQVSTLFQNSRKNHNINVVRINTHTNDLPWEFVMYRVPSLIVFPSGRPDDSRLFPSQLKIDVRNIFSFILAQLRPLDQLHVTLGSCTLPTDKMLKCLKFAKTLAMQQIQEHLRLWQLFEKDREDILTRLKLFKDITLQISKQIFLYDY